MRLKKLYFPHTVHYCCSFMSHLSETRRFLQSSSFWEARPALIGQLSSVLWLTEYLKLEKEMLRPFCGAMSQRDDTRTIKPIINDYKCCIQWGHNYWLQGLMLYFYSSRCITPCKHHHVCIFDRRNDKQALLYTAQNLRLNCQWQKRILTSLRSRVRSARLSLQSWNCPTL